MIYNISWAELIKLVRVMQYVYKKLTNPHCKLTLMNFTRRLSFVAAAAAATLLLLVLVLSSVLPTYEFPNYGYSALMIVGSFAAFYFARRRLMFR